jgi:hypothetical protein
VTRLPRRGFCRIAAEPPPTHTANCEGWRRSHPKGAQIKHLRRRIIGS